MLTAQSVYILCYHEHKADTDCTAEETEQKQCEVGAQSSTRIQNGMWHLHTATL